MAVGEKGAAELYLGKFSWGHSFLTLNEELLDAYTACKDGAEIIQAQQKYLEDAQSERQHRRGVCNLLTNLLLLKAMGKIKYFS